MNSKTMLALFLCFFSTTSIVVGDNSWPTLITTTTVGAIIGVGATYIYIKQQRKQEFEQRESEFQTREDVYKRQLLP